MKPIRSGGLEDNITSATVSFRDTGETYVLKTRAGSYCHFFEQFKVGADDVQLRLDWSQLDGDGHPTLDADFIDPKTGKHLERKGERKCAHSTFTTPGEGRSYEWTFEDCCRQFTVAVAWRVSVAESVTFSDSPSAEVIKAKGRKPERD